MLNITYSQNKGEYFCRVSTMVHLDGTQILSSLHINLFHYAFGMEQKVITTLDGIICQKKFSDGKFRKRKKNFTYCESFKLNTTQGAECVTFSYA